MDKKGFVDLTEDGHTFLTSMKIMGERRGLQTYVLFVRGSKASQIPETYRHHPLHGSGNHKTADWWKCIGIKNKIALYWKISHSNCESLGSILLRDKYLNRETIKKPTYSYCVVSISEKGKRFLDDVQNNRDRGKILIDPPPDLKILLRKKQA